MGQSTSSQPITLNFRSVEQIVVEPDDKDRFVMTMKEVAQACKKHEDDKEWQQQFDSFLIRLREWGAKHSVKVNDIVVAVGDGTLNVFVCTNDSMIDFDFEDEISDLDVALAGEFAWLNADMMQIPISARSGRFPYEKALQVYGDGRRPSKAS